MFIGLIPGPRSEVFVLEDEIRSFVELRQRAEGTLELACQPERCLIAFNTHVAQLDQPTSAANSRNFVLCPSGTYDRSPCGTGTSAKVAALAADGLLAEGEPWVQESITGSRSSAHYRWHDVDTGAVIPTITGSARVTGESRLFFDVDTVV